VAAIGWTLFAFGGVYFWALPISAALVLGAAIAVRPRIGGPTRLFDALLIASALVPIAQAVPLPAALRHVLSPQVDHVNGLLRFGVSTADSGPLSLDPAASLQAGAAGLILAGLFWTCRSLVARGWAERLARPLCWTGFAMAIVAIVTRPAAAEGLIYGFWAPLARGAHPYGPFVNPNDAACWLIMGTALALGCLSVRRRRGRSTRRQDVDAVTLWLGGAVGAMGVGVIASVSRSGAAGLAVALAVGAWLSARKGASTPRWMLGVLAGGALVALVVPRSAVLLERFESIGAKGTEGRMAIWRETMPMVRDFPLVGVGVGAYPMAMRIYQQSDRAFFFNEPHNQLLQIVAEGGVALWLPLGLAALLLARHSRGASGDGLRSWALAGLCGSAAQVMWDVGWSRPANAMLAIVLCAIAWGDPDSSATGL
jgi:O-antigen ligase